MKVLIIHSVYRYQGGEEVVVARETELLRANGIDAEVLFFDNDKHNLIKLLLLPFNIFSFIKTKRKLKAFKPDIVHIHNLHFAASPSVLYAIKRNGIPVVMTLHNFRLVCPSATLFSDGKLFLDSMHQNFPFQAVLKGVYKNTLVTFWVALSMQLHKWLQTWKMVTRFIVLTEHAREVLLKSSIHVTAQQVIIKPNFTSPVSVTENEKEPYFLYVGRLSEEKGIRVLLKAFSIAPFRLKVAGDGPLKREVVEAAKENSNIEFVGKQNKEEVGRLMRHCSAMVFPSIWYEGMPLTIIESFSAGAAVIASRLGAMEAMVSNGCNGLHFHAGDHEDLAEMLNRWMNLPEKEKKRYRNQASCTYQEKYTPENNAVQLLRIYNSAAGSFSV